MKIWRDLKGLPEFRNAVITIGSFDGVHVGHQQIIKRIQKRAAEIDGESVVITFSPHPRTVLGIDKGLVLLSTMEEKVELLNNLEVDHLVVTPFTRDFSQQSPERYVWSFLHKNFNPSVIVIGYDHRFGKNREGDIELLRSMSKELGIEVEEISAKEIDEVAVSSTKVRRALNEGRVSEAAGYLNHLYSLQGIVVRGQQMGRKLGFPTANIYIENEKKLIPQNGVYAVLVHLRNQQLKGMLNIGTRPTVEGQDRSIEVNIFDFNEDVYGDQIKLELVQRIRDEQKFASIEILVEQLKKDQELIAGILATK